MRKIGRGEIVRAGTLFEAYKKRFVAPPKTVTAAAIAVVQEFFHLELTEEQCQYTPTKRTLSFFVSGPLRTEIQFHKKEILKAISEVVGDKSAPREIL